MPALKEDVSSLMDYEDSNDELGLSLSVANRGDLLYQSRPSEYTECLIKRSIWLAKELCEHTDARRLGIPIRLGITTDIYDVAMRYLELCSFPISRVDWIESRESERWAATFFDAMAHPSFNHVKRVLRMNVSFIVHRPPTQPIMPLFETILNIWKDQPLASGGDCWRHRKYWKFPWWSVVGTDKETGHYEHLLRALGGELPAQAWLNSDPFPYVSGSIFGFSQQLLGDEGFLSELDRFHSVLTDEVAISLYIFKYNPSCAVLQEIFVSEENLDSDSPAKLFYGEFNTDTDVWDRLFEQLNGKLD